MKPSHIGMKAWRSEMGGRIRSLSVGACLIVLWALALAIPSYAQALKEGKNADYIPALAKVDPNLFGIAVVTTDDGNAPARQTQTVVSAEPAKPSFEIYGFAMLDIGHDLKQ